GFLAALGAVGESCRPVPIRGVLVVLGVRRGVAVRAVLADGLAGDGMLFRGPGTQVDELAALAAEGTPARGRAPVHRGLAGGTGDLHQPHTVSWKSTSSVVCTGRVWKSCQCMKRMLQRWWLPLISGNSGVPAGSVMRSNWQGVSRSKVTW